MNPNTPFFVYIYESSPSTSDVLPVPLFQKVQESVKNHGDDAQDDNGHQYPGELERLASINDQVAKALPGADKFPYYDADQAESDVYLHNTQNQGDG